MATNAAGPCAATASHGFTLVELMITVAIVAILATVAYPAYSAHLHKARRAEARAAIVETLQQQERYMSQYDTYAAFAHDAPHDGAPFRRHSGSDEANPAFRIGARACAGQSLADCVQVYARPQYSDPAVRELSMTSTGVRDCSASDPGQCWR
ncbi:type IV pilin protein [Melaminivora sp.]|uniref:type IV pilin protein n=1 Tax=Melaminivora sp. TaxID=1933032 RepID=UPI0028A9526B|nr:type IV pilin protein [Melaminivora sp.]